METDLNRPKESNPNTAAAEPSGAGHGVQLILASPRGFCAGVERAIRTVERSLELFGKPIYVRHEIVHNNHVVEQLKDLGVVFVEELEVIPEDSVVIFSAHGASRKVMEEAGRRRLRLIDATCPLVTKVHREVRRHSREGRELVLIGHAGHPEVDGIMGQIEGVMHLVISPEDVAALEVRDPDNLAFVTQTTLSVDDTAGIVSALHRRFPGILGPSREDICYATQNRQLAVRRILDEVDILLVVGSANSSNSNRLRELGEGRGVPSYLVDHAGEVRPEWLTGVRRIGVTAGASAPEHLVQELLEYLEKLMGELTVQESSTIDENVQFSLPI
jgi:4-hydroxy-3-methylbut-2-enyl diphosphate reductase